MRVRPSGLLLSLFWLNVVHAAPEKAPKSGAAALELDTRPIEGKPPDLDGSVRCKQTRTPGPMHASHMEAHDSASCSDERMCADAHEVVKQTIRAVPPFRRVGKGKGFRAQQKKDFKRAQELKQLPLQRSPSAVALLAHSSVRIIASVAGCIPTDSFCEWIRIALSAGELRGRGEEALSMP